MWNSWEAAPGSSPLELSEPDSSSIDVSVEASECGLPCDLDQDGTITVLDARRLVLLCTLPGCEVQQSVCPGDPVPTPDVVGLAQADAEAAIEDACVAAVEKVGNALSDMGHKVESTFPELFFDMEMIRAYMGTVYANTTLFLDTFQERIGRPWTQNDVEKGFDLLISPTLSAPAPKPGYLVEDVGARALRTMEIMPYTLQFNVTGQPAISLPLHWTDDGLPIGVQFVAKLANEALLIRLAAQREESMPWADRKPRIVADG